MEVIDSVRKESCDSRFATMATVAPSIAAGSSVFHAKYGLGAGALWPSAVTRTPAITLATAVHCDRRLPRQASSTNLPSPTRMKYRPAIRCRGATSSHNRARISVIATLQLARYARERLSTACANGAPTTSAATISQARLLSIISASHIPRKAAAPAYNPWLMIRRGPRSACLRSTAHSCGRAPPKQRWRRRPLRRESNAGLW